MSDDVTPSFAISLGRKYRMTTMIVTVMRDCQQGAFGAVIVAFISTISRCMRVKPRVKSAAEPLVHSWLLRARPPALSASKMSGLVCRATQPTGPVLAVRSNSRTSQ